MLFWQKMAIGKQQTKTFHGTLFVSSICYYMKTVQIVLTRRFVVLQPKQDRKQNVFVQLIETGNCVKITYALIAKMGHIVNFMMTTRTN